MITKDHIRPISAIVSEHINEYQISYKIKYSNGPLFQRYSLLKHKKIIDIHLTPSAVYLYKGSCRNIFLFYLLKINIYVCRLSYGDNPLEYFRDYIDLNFENLDFEVFGGVIFK